MEAALKDAVVRFTVGEADGKLQYIMAIPSKQLGNWGIPIEPEDVQRIKVGAELLGVCATQIRFDGARKRSIDLSHHCFNLMHDWSGVFPKAVKLMDEDQFDAAQSLLEKLVVEAPGLHDAHWHLARCYKHHERWDDAIAQYLKAIASAEGPRAELLPMAAETLAHLGILFFKLERPAEALVCLHTALTLDPNHAEALVTYAALFTGNKDVLIACMARLVATEQLPDERGLMVSALCARTGLREAQLARQIQRRAQADAPSEPLLKPSSKKTDDFVKALKEAKEPLVPQLLDAASAAERSAETARDEAHEDDEPGKEDADADEEGDEEEEVDEEAARQKQVSAQAAASTQSMALVGLSLTGVCILGAVIWHLLRS